MRLNQSRVSKYVTEYKSHYKRIKGGIDGYYERVIFESDLYEVIDEEVIACFTVHETRGLTSLLVFNNSKIAYQDVFDFVIDSNLFTNILFTENDFMFYNCIKNADLSYEVQAYNFELETPLESEIKMIVSKEEHHPLIMKEFGEFIKYNNIDLRNTMSLVYIQDNELISFGALEPLLLHDKRYCISMIVSKKHLRKGFGTETVKALIKYLQLNRYEVNARCYVLNDISRKTLLKSGLRISNKLYKVEGLKR